MSPIRVTRASYGVMTIRADWKEGRQAAASADVPAPRPAATWETTYVRLADELTRFASGIVGPHEAPDVVANAVARCLRRDLNSIDNPDAYLYRAVYNEAIGIRRKLARRTRLSHQIPRSPTSSDSHEAGIDDELTVAAGLHKLSTQQRAVIVLTYWRGWTTRDVAEHLDVSEGSIKKQLARARAKLREELS